MASPTSPSATRPPPTPITVRNVSQRLMSHASRRDHQPTESSDTPSNYETNINDLTTRRESSESTGSHESAGRKASIIPTKSAWRTYFLQEIAKDKWLEAQLMLMTIITGIIDAATFTTYKVFVTKQTGNTLFIAIYAFDPQTLGYEVEQNVAVSSGMFVIGGLFIGHIGNHVRQRRRSWLIMTSLFQTVLIYAATAIRYWAPRYQTGAAALGIIALLSFAAAGQISLAVGVGLPELNTTMITGSLVQLTNDSNILKLRNTPRNRRIIFYAALAAGCFVGAAAYSEVETWLGLLIAACLKTVVTFTFICNPGMIHKSREDVEKRAADHTGISTPVPQILWGD